MLFQYKQNEIYHPVYKINIFKLYKKMSVWNQIGANIDGLSNDTAGSSVSLSNDGQTVAIGAPGNNKIRVYEWDGSAWDQKGDDIDGGSLSGFSVSLSANGNVVAIGNRSPSGNVRVFEWNGSAWQQKGIDIDGEAANDYSGYSVSLSADGSVVAIGATDNDGNGNNSGHVRVYGWNGSAWTKRGIDIDGEVADDYSGWSVSLSVDGSVLAIGAPFNDGNNSNSGHVRIYKWDGNLWNQKGQRYRR